MSKRIYKKWEESGWKQQSKQEETQTEKAWTFYKQGEKPKPNQSSLFPDRQVDRREALVCWAPLSHSLYYTPVNATSTVPHKLPPGKPHQRYSSTPSPNRRVLGWTVWCTVSKHVSGFQSTSKQQPGAPLKITSCDYETMARYITDPPLRFQLCAAAVPPLTGAPQSEWVWYIIVQFNLKERMYLVDRKDL